MIVHLDQNEIHSALIEYISNQGYPVSGKKVDVSLTAGRGEKGYSAQLSFETVTSQPAVATDPTQDADDRQQAILFEFQRTNEED